MNIGDRVRIKADEPEYCNKHGKEGDYMGMDEEYEYCNPAFINPFIDDDGLYLFIDKDRLMTGYTDECTFEKSESIKINYCPMCGRRTEGMAQRKGVIG